MDPKILHSSRDEALWELAGRQHFVVTRPQLLELGFRTDAVRHRLNTGRLHRVRPGVYAVGRLTLDQHGRWMAAVLSCGPDAVLSHESAAALWGIRASDGERADVSVPERVVRRRSGIRVCRRTRLMAEDITKRHSIPVTNPLLTLIDIATRLGRDQFEAAVNEADKRDLADPEELRAGLEGFVGQRGVGILRELLDISTFTITDSELERRFLPIAIRAGLPRPRTGHILNGFKVDFYWPDLGLVVETDGLRYHRTPVQQARDRLRDQTHAAAGLTPLRFTRAQVHFEPEHVYSTLVAVARRLRGSAH